MGATRGPLLSERVRVVAGKGRRRRGVVGASSTRSIVGVLPNTVMAGSPAVAALSDLMVRLKKPGHWVVLPDGARLEWVQRAAPVGYRERRRRAKLRRRARDRAIASKSPVRGKEKRRLARRQRRRSFVEGVLPPAERWWSTPEGRADWLQDDMARKYHRREARRDPWVRS